MGAIFFLLRELTGVDVAEDNPTGNGDHALGENKELATGEEQVSTPKP